MSGYDNTSETVRTTSATAVTVTNNDYDLLLVVLTGATAVTLPDPTKIQPGRLYRIYKDASAQTVTITSAGSGLIDGGANTTLATGAVHAKAFLTDGVNWFTVTAY